MRIFITGSSGFIGSELIKYLSKNKKYTLIKYDLVNGQDILDYPKLKKAMSGCDIVIHLAAHRKPYEDKTFEDYFKTNCEGTFNVAKAALENKVKKFIYSSSTSYYGFEQGIPIQKPVKESNFIITQHLKELELNCRDCDISYSTSKVIAEQIIANYGLRKKFEVIILRFGPTRKTGEYRPFGELKLHLKIENAIQSIEKAILSDKKLWYEAFTITDKIPNVDISKAKKLLGYIPE